MVSDFFGQNKPQFDLVRRVSLEFWPLSLVVPWALVGWNKRFRDNLGKVDRKVGKIVCFLNYSTFKNVPTPLISTSLHKRNRMSHLGTKSWTTMDIIYWFSCCCFTVNRNILCRTQTAGSDRLFHTTHHTTPFFLQLPSNRFISCDYLLIQWCLLWVTSSASLTTVLCPAAVWRTCHTERSRKSDRSCNYYWRTSSLKQLPCGWLLWKRDPAAVLR